MKRTLLACMLVTSALGGHAWGQAAGMASMPGMAHAAKAPALATATPPAAKVMVSHGWARASAPGQTDAAAYIGLSSNLGDRLVGVDTDQAGMAMLHQETKRNGVAEMRDLDAVALPAGKTVRLAPGGIHIMLMDLKAPLKAGDTLRLSLSFAHAGRQDITVPVLPLGATGP